MFISTSIALPGFPQRVNQSLLRDCHASGDSCRLIALNLFSFVISHSQQVHHLTWKNFIAMSMKAAADG
jgi:hypothetical protein